jgi:enoyl-CoA hydratase
MSVGMNMDALQFEVVDGIALMMINRAQARNSIDHAAAVGIADAIERIETDANIRLGILTGAGGTFCAGMDLKAFLRGEQVRFPGSGFGGLTERRTIKPLIAAVEGYALAGGFELALACDLIVAASDARFGLPEVKRGLVPNAGGLLRLPRQLPFRIAMELVLTGEMVTSATLESRGLINRVVQPGTALEEARRLAAVIVANGPLALAACKRVMTESQDWDSRDMFARQAEITGPVLSSLDAQEGAKAFAEKRTPQWRGA